MNKIQFSTNKFLRDLREKKWENREYLREEKELSDKGENERIFSINVPKKKIFFFA